MIFSAVQSCRAREDLLRTLTSAADSTNRLGMYLNELSFLDEHHPVSTDALAHKQVCFIDLLLLHSIFTVVSCFSLAKACASSHTDISLEALSSAASASFVCMLSFCFLLFCMLYYSKPLPSYCCFRAAHLKLSHQPFACLVNAARHSALLIHRSYNPCCCSSPGAGGTLGAVLLS